MPGGAVTAPGEGRRWGLRWFAPAPARRLALLRISIGGFGLAYVAARAPHLISFGSFDSDRFDPVGVVGVLSAPLDAWVVTLAVALTAASGVGFVAGWRYRVTGPAFALLFLWVTTYRNSWGTVLHTENLLALHLLVVGVVAAADAYSLDARRRRTGDPDRAHWRYGWPIRLLCLVTVLAYFVSGWAKLRFGGWDWIAGDVLRNQIAYDNLRKLLLGDAYSPVGGWLVAHGWAFVPMAMGTAVIEAGAPLAMLNERLGKVWAGLTWLFHLAILALMAIVFPYQLSGIGLASFFRVERGWDRLRAWGTARLGRAPPAGARPIPEP